MAPEPFFRINPFQNIGESPVFLCLDFDGTLVPIQTDPAACILDEETRDTLTRLAAMDRCRIAVLSGRKLSDVQERVGIEGIYYGGNHGLHLTGPGLTFVHPGAVRARRLIAHFRRSLEKETRDLKGVWIEDKGLTLALHFRLAPKAEAESARHVFLRLLAADPGCSDLSCMKGKKVMELMPRVLWDKGRAALFILSLLPPNHLPVYAGDDRTDETAFTALAAKGITVRVGRSRTTTAGYYLARQRDVLRFLKALGDALSVPGPSAKPGPAG